jgi:hypothetical protein
VIHPDLMYQLWKQEHNERLRTAVHRQTIRDAKADATARTLSGSDVVKPAPRQLDSPAWLRVLRLWRLWTIS